MNEKEYTFTEAQLFALLKGVIELRDEYRNCHGDTAGDAMRGAILDTIEGLDAEKELLEIGKRFTPSQVLK